MAKKRNKELRPLRDHHARKRMNEQGWADKLLQQIKDGVEADETPNKRRKGRKDDARRLTGISL